MKLLDFLKTMTEVGDTVYFYVENFSCGATFIDEEDRFILSLDKSFLGYTVVEYRSTNNKVHVNLKRR